MRWRKPLAWIAGVAAAVVFLIGVAVLSAPLWLDTEGVRTRIVDSLAKATGGSAQFERIDLRFLPPGANVTKPRFSLPDMLDLDAQSGSIDLDLLALLRARIQLATLRLVAPRIVVHLPEPSQNAEPFSIESAEQTLREVSARIAESAPEMQFIVEDGSASLLAGGSRLPLLFDGVQLSAEVTDDGIEATGSCSSSLWDQLTLQMNPTDDTLTGDGTVKIIGLRAHDLGKFIGQDETWPIRDAVVDANLKWQMNGLTDILAEGNLSAANVSLSFDQRGLDLQRPTIDLSAQWRDGVAAISARKLVLDYPRIDATAKLTRSESGEFALQATATDVDLSALQTTVASFAPGVSLLARTTLNIEQGTINSVQMSSEAATLPGLLRPQALHAQIEIAAVDALVGDLDLRIRKAGGTVSLKAGELEVRNATASVGKSALSDANISASLGTLLAAPASEQDPRGDDAGARQTGAATKNAKPVPMTRERIELIAKQLALRADARLSLDLAEVLAIAKSIVGDGKARTQLDQIKTMSGRAEFHTSVTTDSQHPELRLEISAIQTTTQHAKVPFAIPVQLTRGDFRYVDNAMYVQDLRGAIGKSTFKGAGARIGINAPNALGAGKGSFSLALDELMRWAAALPELSKHLADIEKVTGTMSVSISKLAGTLRKPDKLQYVLSASPQRVSITAARFGPSVKLDGGVIDISNTRIRMNDVRLSALDASLRVGGTMKDYRDGLTNFQARIDGSTGLESLEWLRVRAGLADTMRMRKPWQISRLDAKWRRDGELSARGKIQVKAGPAIGFAMGLASDLLEVENFSLRDEFSEVEAGGKLEDTHFDVRFKGKLLEQSLTNIFTQLPLKFGRLNGDIRATGDWKHPDRTAANGVLQGTMIGIPAALLGTLPVPVTVENFSLEGQNQTLLIKTATVAVDDSRLDISGSFGVSGNQYLLDADLTSQRFVVQLPSRSSRSGSKSAPDSGTVENTEATIDRMTLTGETNLTNIETLIERFPGSGQIRINISKLQIGQRELTPFIAAASLGDQKLVLKLRQARLCNILLTGGMDAVMHGHANLNVEVHTRGVSIERSIPCLTNKNILLTGLMDVDAQFLASGTGSEFLDSLRVTYTLALRDGEIRKFDALGKVIDAVNETEAADGKLPSTKTSNLKYKVISAKGSADLRTLLFNEIVVELEQAKMVAQGTVDIQTAKINATVLVAPLQGVDKLINRVPILGRIFGGSVLAVPVGVSGTIKDPVVLPLAPGAVAGRMVDILTNTLKLPADLLNTTMPDLKKSSPPASRGTSER
jgi:hypothetical protein